MSFTIPRSKELGLSKKEKQSYSLLNALGHIQKGNWNELSLEREASEAIAERNAFNCECERHDLLACKMQGHDVCFAAVTRLRTFIKAIECAAVVYGGHEQRR